MSLSALKSWEAGKTSPDCEFLWRLCEALGTDPNTLLGWYETHPAEGLEPDERDTLEKYRQLTPSRKEAVGDMLDGLVAKSKASGSASGSVRKAV